MEVEMTGGWIYVLMTSADYGRYKVGRTIGSPLVRFKALRTADPKLGLEIAYFVPSSFDELSRVEAALHRNLVGRMTFHDEVPSEWFAGDVKAATEWIECLFAEWWGDGVVSDWFRPDLKQISRVYEGDLLSIYGPPPDLDEYGIPW
jgi:hypothetical protein